MKKNTEILIFTFDSCGDTNSVEQLVLSVNPQAQVFSSSLPISFLKNAEQLKQLEEKTSDFAVLVFNANDTRITLEENRSIGYGVFYKLLQRITNNRVLIVLTGDNSFDKSPHPTLPVLSAPVYSNFFAGEHHVIPMEYFNGTKSFVFSWGKRHSAVHVLALEHFLNNKAVAFKFESPNLKGESKRGLLCSALSDLLKAVHTKIPSDLFDEIRNELAAVHKNSTEGEFLERLTDLCKFTAEVVLASNSPAPAVPTASSSTATTTQPIPSYQGTGRAIPLILPNNVDYDAKTGRATLNSQQRKNLLLNREALEIIRGIKTKVAVLTIMGPARAGKSYILSKILGHPNCFKAGHSMNPETFGIWMWSEPIIHELPNKETVSVILLDTEGIDSHQSSAGSDNQICTLSILLSSLLVYNSKAAPHMSDLSVLEFVTSISKNVQLKTGQDLYQSGLDKELENAFPFFFWLMRDVHLKPQIDNKECSFRDYIDQVVLQKPKSKKTDTKSLQNKVIISNLRLLFKNFDAAMLPIPSASTTILQNIGDNDHLLSSDFHQKVNLLIRQLHTRLPVKKSHKGEPLTGVLFAQMVDHYVKEINTPGRIPSIESAWETVVTNIMNESALEAVEAYAAEMKQVVLLFPTSQERILDMHKELLQKVLKQFEEKHKTEDKIRVEKYLQQISKQAAQYEGSKIVYGILLIYLTENSRISEEKCRAAMDASMRQITQFTSQVHEQCTIEEFEKKVQEQRQVFTNQTKGLPSSIERAVELEEFFAFQREGFTALLQRLKFIHKQLEELKTKQQSALSHQDAETRAKLEKELAKMKYNMEEESLKAAIKYRESAELLEKAEKARDHSEILIQMLQQQAQLQSSKQAQETSAFASQIASQLDSFRSILQISQQQVNSQVSNLQSQVNNLRR